MVSTNIPFAEPTGEGRVIVSPAGRRLRLGIDKEAVKSGRILVVHAALSAAEATQLRDALDAWLTAQEAD